MRNFLLKHRSALMTIFLFFPFILLAQGISPISPVNSSGDSSKLNPLGSVNTIWQLLINIFGALLELALPIAVLMLVYSGYLFVTAMGDEKQVNSAKDNFKWTITGIAVLLGARALVDVVRQTIEGIN